MSKHYGHVSRDTKAVELDFWLTVSCNVREFNARPGVKVTAGYPALARNERAMNLKISLPTALFELPSLSASIKVDSPQQAIEIDATAIAEAVQTVIGMDVDVQVVAPEQQP